LKDSYISPSMREEERKIGLLGKKKISSKKEKTRTLVGGEKKQKEALYLPFCVDPEQKGEGRVEGGKKRDLPHWKGGVTVQRDKRKAFTGVH